MTFNSQLPLSWLLFIGLVTVLITVLSIWTSPKLKKSGYKYPILGFRIVVIGLLLFVLMNPVKIKKNKKRIHATKDIVLVDASQSMNLESPISRLAELKSVLNGLDKEEQQNLIYYKFDTIGKQVKSFEKIEDLEANGGLSNLSNAVENILNEQEAKTIRNLIICSDGRMSDESKLEQVITKARGFGIPISVLGIGHKTDLFNTAIKECSVPRTASSNTKVIVKVILENKGTNNEAFQLNLKNSKGKIIAKKIGYLKDGLKAYRFPLTTGTITEKYEVAISPISGELTAMDNNFKFKIEISNPKIKVLYLEGTNNNYSKSSNRSLGSWPAYKFIHEACRRTGRIEMDTYLVDRQQNVGGEIYNVKTRKKGYPKSKKELLKYDVIICSDINRFVFNDAQLKWTRELVAENGAGFCMIGGDTSFGSGGYDKTIWEQMIPVDMKTFNQGHIATTVHVTIPEKSLKHPIWQIEDNLELNRKIIKAHPSFKGTNTVNRVKPGATVLAYWKQHKNMPLISVQPYGKGRSMAFTSDAAGGWGQGYQESWGKTRNDNAYYQKFWVNAVTWLAENSEANKKKNLICNTNKLSYHLTDTVHLEAELNTVEKGVKIQASFVNYPNLKTNLTFNNSKQLFVGSIHLPEKTKKNSLKLVCKAIDKSGIALSSDTLNIPIKRVSLEYKNTNPDFKSLEKLMILTGGKNIQSVADLNSLLKNKTESKSNSEEIQKLPIWDQWWLWSLIIILLGLEWLIRKRYL